MSSHREKPDYGQLCQMCHTDLALLTYIDRLIPQRIFSPQESKPFQCFDYFYMEMSVIHRDDKLINASLERR